MKLIDIKGPDKARQRFEAKVDRSPVDSDYSKSGCHLWLGGTNKQGYGAIKVSFIDGTKRVIGAHRFALFLATGVLPESSVQTLHSCDHPSCVNPDHLRWGSNTDNVKDRVVRERNSSIKGELNGRAKLTEEDVKAIRAEPDTWGVQSKLARQYKVDQSLIFRIRRGTLWADVA